MHPKRLESLLLCISLCVAAAAFQGKGTPEKQGAKGKLPADDVILAVGEEGMPLTSFLKFAQKVTGRAFVIDPRQLPRGYDIKTPKQGIRMAGPARLKKSEFYSFCRALLAPSWRCVERDSGVVDLVWRGGPRDERKEAILWVAPDRLREFKSKANVYIRTTLRIKGTDRTVTIGGFGPDVYAMAKLAR